VEIFNVTLYPEDNRFMTMDLKNNMGVKDDLKMLVIIININTHKHARPLLIVKMAQV